MMSKNIDIGGGFSDSTNIETFAGMIGDIYGGGEYAVSESDLLSIHPDTKHNIMVFGSARPTHIQEPHSASTVEIELRDLFQFPKKQSKVMQGKVMQGKKVRKVNSRRKKGGEPISAVPQGDDSAKVVKLRDVADMDIKHLLSQESDKEHRDKPVLDSSIVDDYTIASIIDQKSGGESGGESSSENSDDENSSDDNSDDENSSSTDSSSSSDEAEVKSKVSPEVLSEIKSDKEKDFVHESPKNVLDQDELKEADVPSDISTRGILADNILHDDELNIFHAIAN